MHASTPRHHGDARAARRARRRQGAAAAARRKRRSRRSRRQRAARTRTLSAQAHTHQARLHVHPHTRSTAGQWPLAERDAIARVGRRAISAPAPPRPAHRWSREFAWHARTLACWAAKRYRSLRLSSWCFSLHSFSIPSMWAIPTTTTTLPRGHCEPSCHTMYLCVTATPSRASGGRVGRRWGAGVVRRAVWSAPRRGQKRGRSSCEARRGGLAAGALRRSRNGHGGRRMQPVIPHRPRSTPRTGQVVLSSASHPPTYRSRAHTPPPGAPPTFMCARTDPSGEASPQPPAPPPGSDAP